MGRRTLRVHALSLAAPSRRARAAARGTGARAAPVDATAARENDMEGRLESSRREMRPRVISRGGRPRVGIQGIRPRVSRMTRRCSRRRCRRSVVSGVRSFDCALLRGRQPRISKNPFQKPKNSFCSREKSSNSHFPETGTHTVGPIGPNNLNGKSASRPVAARC